jgi:ABC-type arginine transport system permease subunit
LGTLALALVMGAYATEVIRGAILSVDEGQVQAASALALHRWHAFFLVILAQAFRITLPGLSNLWMTIVKKHRAPVGDHPPGCLFRSSPLSRSDTLSSRIFL